MKIQFFTEDVVFVLREKQKLRNWLSLVITSEGFQYNQINFVFCSDAYLLEINKNFLNHDYYTDIITFDYGHATDKKKISGDLFLSYERIVDNAVKLKKDLSEEIHRVMIHGILHLMGHNDKNKIQKLGMRALENYYLQLKLF